MSALAPVVFRLSTSSGRRGTAFLLQPGYALTAAHCVTDDGGELPTVTLELAGRQYSAEVIWTDQSEGSARCDGAILKVVQASITGSEPAGPPLAVRRLPRRALPNSTVQWHAFGYPVMDPEQMGLDLSGSIGGIQKGAGIRRLQLTCDQFGADGAGLQGVSGGPVTVNAYTVALISRNPSAFRQRIVYASMLEDIFAEFFRSASSVDAGAVKVHAETLRPAFANLDVIELDEADRALNQYITSLRRRGKVFHELAVRTPLCRRGALESSDLDNTYVQASLHRISTVHDFWTANVDQCQAVGPAGNGDQQRSLGEVVTKCTSLQPPLRLVIAGGAGAGKTTVLNYIALKSLFSPDEVGLRAPMLPLVVSLPQLAKVKCVDGFTEWLKRARAKGLDVCSPHLDAKFFNEFPERIGAEWLLLLDGFDEVSELGRIDLLRSLRECVRDRPLHWCLTSRPAATLKDPLIDISQWPGVQSYKIVPWTDAEQHSFATAILGEEKAREFLRRFRFIVLDRSTATPLLTLIAICVFQDSQGRMTDLSKGEEASGTGVQQVPRTKAELYAAFVDNSVLRGLQRPASNVPEWIEQEDREPLVNVLSRLAIYSTENPAADRVSDLLDWLGMHLRETELATRVSGGRRSREFVQHVGAGSGLVLIEVTRNGDRWRWWHSAVRDYLAALAIANGSPQGQRDILRKRGNSTWDEVIIFMMAILSARHAGDPERHPNITGLFRYLLDTDSECGLLLYTALAEGAAVDENMEGFVISQLVEAAKRLGHADCEHYNLELGLKGRSPVQLLAKLSDRSNALRGLREIKDDLEIGPWMRGEAEEALGRID
jgi:hypothetical protein